MRGVKKLLCLLLCVCVLAGTCGSADVQASGLEAGGAAAIENSEEEQKNPETPAVEEPTTEEVGEVPGTTVTEPTEEKPEEIPDETPAQEAEQVPEENTEKPAETVPETTVPAQDELSAENAATTTEEELPEENAAETEEETGELDSEELQLLLDEAYAEAIAPKNSETGYQELQAIYVEEDVLEQLFAQQEPQTIMETASVEGVNSYGSTYAYEHMSSAQKQVYNEIDQRCKYYLNSNANFVSYNSSASLDSYRIDYHGLSSQEAFNVYTMYAFANPQYYFLYNGIVYNYAGFYIVSYAAFTDGNTRAGVTSQFLSRVRSWVSDVSSQRGAYYKEKKAADIVCQNVSYQFGTYDQTAYSAVMQGRTVCAGYSKLYTMLCNGAGVETMGVTSSNHAWNLTYLYGQWYDVDTTNGDDGSSMSLNFFNVSDDFLEYVGYMAGADFDREYYWSGRAPSAPDIYIPFSDVPEDCGWRFEAINLVYGSGIMNGISGTTRFEPDANLTRAMFATMIYRLQGSPSASYRAVFPDVPSGNYFSIPIVWANREGILNGHSNTGLFGTWEDITREDVVTVIYRYAAYTGCSTSGRDSLSKFPDAGKVSSYAKTAMQWAVANGIITGRSDTGVLDPQGNATRVECAAILQRFIEKYMPQKIK